MSRTIWLTESWLQAQLTEAGRWAYIDLVEDRTGRGRSWDADDILGVITAAQFPLVSAAIREAEARGRERGLVRAFDLIGDERMTTVTEMKRQRKRGLDDSWYRQRLAVINKIQGDVRSAARGVRVESPAEETQP